MIKVFFRRIHLYLSLAAGLVILICCLTGAILVFEKELQMAFNKHRYYVTAGATKLPIEQLIANVKTAFPDAKINGVKLYNQKDRSAEVSVTFKKEEAPKPAATKAGPPPRQPGFTIFVNPYTGQVLEKYSYRETFFFQVFAMHRWLLGGEDSIGKIITGVSTLLFLFILITGIILWWPKTKKIMQQRLKIKWNAGWKRINHDMHLVFGFYSAIFLFIFAFTALAWSFEWFNEGIYTVTASPLKPPPPPKSAVAANEKITLNAAFATAQKMYPEAVSYNLSAAKDSTDVVTVSVLPDNALHEGATDALYIDQYSGAVAGQLPFTNRSTGAKVRSAFKPIHTGSIGGTPTKIIAFIVCLLGVTFPITGVIIWLNRTRKKKQAAAKSADRFSAVEV